MEFIVELSSSFFDQICFLSIEARWVEDIDVEIIVIDPELFRDLHFLVRNKSTSELKKTEADSLDLNKFFSCFRLFFEEIFKYLLIVLEINMSEVDVVREFCLL